MANRKILVTGASGFLGGHVMQRLSWGEWGTDVIGVGSAEANLTSQIATCALMNDHAPDSVIHLAAVCGGIGANRSEPGRFLYANADMALNVIEASRICGVKKVVMVGSVCQYPEHTPAPFKESDLWNGYPDPTNAPYGIAKRLGMEMLKSYHQQYGLNGVFLIPANLYGPCDTFDPARSHAIPAIIRKMVEAKNVRVTDVDHEKSSVSFESITPTVKLWGTGKATRDFLYVEDAAEAIVMAEAADLPGFGAMNLGTGIPMAISGVAMKIARIIGFNGSIEWDHTMPDGQMQRWIDSTRAQQVLGWRAQTRLDEGLAKTIEWYQANAHTLA